jgi:hypothetical protein
MTEGEGIETLILKLKPELLATYPTWEHDHLLIRRYVISLVSVANLEILQTGR